MLNVAGFPGVGWSWPGGSFVAVVFGTKMGSGGNGRKGTIWGHWGLLHVSSVGPGKVGLAVVWVIFFRRSTFFCMHCIVGAIFFGSFR